MQRELTRVLFHMLIYRQCIWTKPVPECGDCSATVAENAGRWVILGEKADGGGFDWMFLCIKCLRDWKQRGLEREGYAPEDIKAMLDKSYPIA